ncbi:MAG TPA: glycosyltransferase family 4 protein [Terriglobales bacterium]|nr:glycosyltransferase family 4 protein [Terriglobales bacterium]
MKILYVSQYFPPEMGAPAARAAELSRHWARMGHDVTVLTGFPNHPTGLVPEEWRSRLRGILYKENVDGVRVVRTWLWPLPNRKTHERIRNYASFFVSSSISGLDLEKPDVVIATSPQLLVALSGWWLAWWKRVPFVFEVRDLWPESLAAVGAGREGSLLHRTLGVIAGFLYRRANHIVVVTPAFKDHLMRHWRAPETKISIVENGVETDLFRVHPAASEVRRELHLENRFLICYIGTMGMAHGLERLITAAQRLQTALPAATFLLIGEGAEKQRISDLAAARGLANIQFLDQQPRERIPVHISAADVGLVLLKKTELFKTVIPTKLLEYMACQRPVIVAVDGQARQVVEAAGAGVFVEPEDSDALVQAILNLAADPGRRQRMGISGRNYIVSQLSRERTAQKYLKVLGKVITEKREGR